MNRPPADAIINTNALTLNDFTCHCEPEGRGNLVFVGDCFVAPLLAKTDYLLRLNSFGEKLQARSPIEPGLIECGSKSRLKDC
jgi:hypothetical protein